MLAKLSSKSQITIPTAIIEQFPDNEYIVDVTVKDGRIVLTPVRATCADEVRAQIAKRGITEADVADAVKQERQDSQDGKAVRVRAETTYTLRTEVDADGVINLRGLSLAKGERVEVVIKRLRRLPENSERYPLRGLPHRYDSPFEPAVPADEWAALK